MKKFQYLIRKLSGQKNHEIRRIGRTEGQKDRRTEGRKDRRTEGRKDRRTEGQKNFLKCRNRKDSRIFRKFRDRPGGGDRSRRKTGRPDRKHPEDFSGVSEDDL